MIITVFYIFIANLFPYGVDVGDVLAPHADDHAFGPVHMDYPIVIFQNSEDSLYVSCHWGKAPH